MVFLFRGRGRRRRRTTTTTTTRFETLNDFATTLSVPESCNSKVAEFLLLQKQFWFYCWLFCSVNLFLLLLLLLLSSSLSFLLSENKGASFEDEASFFFVRSWYVLPQQLCWKPKLKKKLKERERWALLSRIEEGKQQKERSRPHNIIIIIMWTHGSQTCLFRSSQATEFLGIKRYLTTCRAVILSEFGGPDVSLSTIDISLYNSAFCVFSGQSGRPVSSVGWFQALGFGATRFGLVVLYAEYWNNTTDSRWNCRRMWLCTIDISLHNSTFCVFFMTIRQTHVQCWLIWKLLGLEP